MGIDFSGSSSLDNLGLGKTHKLNAPAETLNPTYTSLVGNVAKTAKSYRAGLPGLQADKANAAVDTGRMQLARSYADADRGANARGMFWGGKRAGMRSDAESQVAGDVASKIRQINLDTEDTASGLENTGIEAAYQMKNDQQSLYDQAYNQALSGRQAAIDKKRGWGNSMGKTGGGLVGGLLGGLGGGGKKDSDGGGAASRTA
jgi:hypothetical protein